MRISVPSQDEYWSPTERETWQHLCERISSVMHGVLSRPVPHVAVVTHGVWMEALHQMVLQASCALLTPKHGVQPISLLAASHILLQACHCASQADNRRKVHDALNY